jgi:glycerol uptake facilitator-like aquaporin
MTVELIEFLLGLYFIGIAVSITSNYPNGYTKSVDLFKLVLGILLLILAFSQGVSFI